MRERNIMLIAVIIFILLIVLVGRVIVVFGGPSSNLVCKNEYGAEWEVQYTKNFGTTCVKLDYITLKPTERKQLDFWGIIEGKDYCDRPGFFEFSDWDPKCIKYDVVDGSEIIRPGLQKTSKEKNGK